MTDSAPRNVFVHAEWDGEAGVWVATSDDVPGLATEADTTEALVAKLESADPRTSGVERIGNLRRSVV
ncbi:MAG: DUF1902 domain-containing protein [Sulfuricella sp.]|nr:DUF1902 domain-containing protein [Sulfuricella sp.]